MKALVIIRLALSVIMVTSAFSFTLPFQPNGTYHKKSKTIKAKIISGSTVVIRGTTNMNTFICQYGKEIEVYSKSFEMYEFDNLWSLSNAFIEMNVNSFDCGIKKMNHDFCNLLCEERYPKLIIQVQNLRHESDSIIAESKVTIAGVTRNIKVPIIHCEEEGTIHLTGFTILDIENFNLIAPKKFFGLVKVNKEVIVDFDLLVKIDVL